MSERQLGAVITFPKGTTLEEAQDILKSLYKGGDIDHVPLVNQFNPDHGGPVWYVP